MDSLQTRLRLALDDFRYHQRCLVECSDFDERHLLKKKVAKAANKVRNLDLNIMLNNFDNLQ